MKSSFKISTEGEKEKIRLNRRLATFLACILLSVFFWLMMSLSKEYTITMSYPAAYVNGPTDKIVANTLPDHIAIDIRSKGFFLLVYKFRKLQTINIDLNDIRPLTTKNNFYLLTNSKIGKVTGQFSSHVQVIRVSPDTLFLNFNKKVTKLVPVKPNIQLELGSQFQLTDSIQLNPSMVEISGAADVLDKIDHLETTPMMIKNITESKSVTVSLLKPAQPAVELQRSEVQALINVKKYTEGSIELVVEAINLPVGYTLKAFPDRVQVRYNVAFENYDKVNSSMFKAVIDYKKMEPGSNKLKVTLEKVPEEVRAVKLSPERVEYIIRK